MPTIEPGYDATSGIVVYMYDIRDSKLRGRVSHRGGKGQHVTACNLYPTPTAAMI